MRRKGFCVVDRERMISELRREYLIKRDAIEAKLRKFERVREKGDLAAFEEMCYCLFTAGASAKVGMRSVEAIRDLMLTGSQEELSEKLRSVHPYARKRAEYVVLAREFVRKRMNFKIFDTLDPMEHLERRDFIVHNIKGLGYKEGSHFLRNIGYKGYAILDRHILRNLRRFGITDLKSSPSSRRRYLEVEEAMRRLALEIGVDFDALDLLFWSDETGEILK